MKTNKIQLFHGTTFSRATNIKAEGPCIKEGRALDFGAGFYATESGAQAFDWACRKAKRENDAPFVLTFDINLEKLSVLQFDKMSDAWLEFVYRCRKLRIRYDFDCVCGPMCDGNMALAMRARTKDDFFREITASDIGYQYCFHTKKAIDAIRWR